MHQTTERTDASQKNLAREAQHSQVQGEKVSDRGGEEPGGPQKTEKEKRSAGGKKDSSRKGQLWFP